MQSKSPDVESTRYIGIQISKRNNTSGVEVCASNGVFPDWVPELRAKGKIARPGEYGSSRITIAVRV